MCGDPAGVGRGEQLGLLQGGQRLQRLRQAAGPLHVPLGSRTIGDEPLDDANLDVDRSLHLRSQHRQEPEVAARQVLPARVHGVPVHQPERNGGDDQDECPGKPQPFE
jgi:hypothetical protein